MITLRHIYTVLFIVGLFFIPFNNFEGLPLLGEYQREAASYLFIIGFLVLCVESVLKGSINLPYNNIIFQVVCLFVLWTILATLFNLPTVLDSYYKQTSGISRFIRQFISLTLSAFIFFSLFWNVVRNMTLEQTLLTIRKTLFVALVFVFVYGVIETAIVVFGIGQLFPVIKLFEVFPFVNVDLYLEGSLKRIKGVSHRVPDLGTYLVYISAWMFSYILTHKGFYRFIPTLMVLFLMFFSGSRTALVNVIFQLVVFLAVLYFSRDYKQHVVRLVGASFIIIAVALVFNSKTIITNVVAKIESLDITKKTDHDISNRTRFGMQYASLQVFKQNPITGVGLGQETYHKIYEYPYWSTYKNWEYEHVYKNQQIKSFPPAYNIYTRLLSETGIIGFSLFVLMLTLTIVYSYRLWKSTPKGNIRVASLVLFTSFMGFAVNWLQVDHFKQYGFWLCLAVLIKFMFDTKNNETTSIVEK